MQYHLLVGAWKGLGGALLPVQFGDVLRAVALIATLPRSWLWTVFVLLPKHRRNAMLLIHPLPEQFVRCNLFLTAYCRLEATPRSADAEKGATC